MKLSEVNESNEDIMMDSIKKNRAQKVNCYKPSKFGTGDRVRIRKHKMTFAKVYSPYWSNEIFVVHQVQSTTPVTYLLKDNIGKVLKGSFYEHAISKSEVRDVLLVEKWLKKRATEYVCIGYDTWICNKTCYNTVFNIKFLC